jgi:hypothetical protein
MDIPLTPQQQQELDKRTGELPRVVDPRTNAVYVLIPESDYRTSREGLDDESQQRAIRAVGLRNAAGRLDEAICQNPARSASLWGRIFNSRPARLSATRLEFLDTKVVWYDWERLRLAYNAILIGVVLAATHFVGVGEYPLWGLYVIGDAFVANICFCAGPVAEGYLCWFGLDRHRARWMVFLVGIFFAVWFAILEVQRLAVLPPAGGFFS